MSLPRLGDSRRFIFTKENDCFIYFESPIQRMTCGQLSSKKSLRNRREPALRSSTEGLVKQPKEVLCGLPKNAPRVRACLFSRKKHRAQLPRSLCFSFVPLLSEGHKNRQGQFTRWNISFAHESEARRTKELDRGGSSTKTRSRTSSERTNAVETVGGIRGQDECLTRSTRHVASGETRLIEE